ncbi:hypothetical protein SC1_02392 [Sphingopyxis sp. C-1]|nr:hypothetical protein SC1_02392 [Sphingopyxis sp. C-1]
MPRGGLQDETGRPSRPYLFRKCSKGAKRPADVSFPYGVSRYDRN